MNKNGDLSIKRITTVLLILSLIIVSNTELVLAASSTSTSSNTFLEVLSNIYIFVMIILIPVVFFWIVIKIYWLLPRNQKYIEENKNNPWFGAGFYNFSKVQEVVPDFSEEDFKTFTFDMFKEIEMAMMKNSSKKLNGLVSNHLYDIFNKQISELKEKEQKNIISDLFLVYVYLEGIKKTDVTISIVVRMMTESYDYIVDKNNKIVSGYADKRIKNTYLMTFTRSISPGKNVCFNCDRYIGKDLEKCPMCGEKIINGKYDWILTQLSLSSTSFDYDIVDKNA